MEKINSELQTFLKLLEKKEKMVAMLAPSFPIEFSYPEIVNQLKKLGFKAVVEVAQGAGETNHQILELLKKNPKKRYITNPCPAIVRLIRHKYPQLVSFLAPAFSPMIWTAKLVAEKYPGLRPIFIGPCPAKKFEAREDHPELKIVVLTYKEIKKILADKRIEDQNNGLAGFDLAGPKTRLYPISGGLAQSLGINSFLTDEEYDVVSGLKLVEQALKNFEKNKKIRLLDALFCDGGCITGQGIESKLSLKARREKIITHWL